ncbi:DNA cytosine methyltransferase [Levilactobacillus brevis]|uniref:DNA cytosine methyltransferase n=1 Tax=Levilactobacillus brevis TaxID=1580 RepID=UPI00063AA6AA|nr:DNA cytosine methyltransferase [Levilactobacillus brevis]KLE30785.1 methyltransferase [Levilactobacillus brevis]MCT3569113.1 DNA cytosine methyltransferase [Levilactobacillus brevis]MCT3578682.1 DNA cytosine methyltransferase [Levilactobacillus brevis]
MKFIDLFAGIGGFHLGMEQAGHECVGWVEWDKFARKSYQAIHDVKGVWNASDIRTVKSTEIPRADCWCFGFPCQDISVAGKQKGFTAGKRSSLFFTVTGLIRDLEEKDRPSYLLIENVKNLLSINGGFDFLKLQVELDEIGYDVEWDVLDSAQVVPQHRERIFIVGHLRGQSTRKVFPIVKGNREVDSRTDSTNTLTTRYGEAQGAGSYIAESKPSQVRQIGNISSSNSFGGNPQIGRVYDLEGISPTLSTMQGGGQEPKVLVNLQVRKLTPLECWRLQGFPDWAFARAKQAGLSDTQLYKQAGNSVTVPVIRLIAERMALI